MTASVAVLGGGAWGTAFAIHLATRTHRRPRVALYVRSRSQARDLIASGENRRYLPGVALPSEIAVTSDLADIRADLLFAATPVAQMMALRASLERAGLSAPLMTLAKGFVATSARRAMGIAP